MGKGKVLDAENKQKVKSEKLKIIVSSNAIRYTLHAVFLLLPACLLFLSSCALPRIIVLDDPLSPEEHINLGVAYEKKGELDNALKEYKEASKKLPAAHLYMGNIYFQKKEFDEAESSFRKAIKKDPQNSDAYNNLAWLYYIKKERLDEAEALALKAIELNPAKKDIYQDTLEKIRELKILLIEGLPDKCERARE